MPGRSWPSLLPAGTGPIGRVGRPEWAVRADEAVWTGLPFVPAVAGSCHRAGGAQDGDSWACETLTMCRLALYRNVSPRSGAGPPSTSAPVGLGRGPGCSLLATLTPAQGPHWRREAVGPSWGRRAGPQGAHGGPACDLSLSRRHQGNVTGGVNANSALCLRWAPSVCRRVCSQRAGHEQRCSLSLASHTSACPALAPPRSVLAAGSAGSTGLAATAWLGFLHGLGRPRALSASGPGGCSPPGALGLAKEGV